MVDVKEDLLGKYFSGDEATRLRQVKAMGHTEER